MLPMRCKALVMEPYLCSMRCQIQNGARPPGELTKRLQVSAASVHQSMSPWHAMPAPLTVPLSTRKQVADLWLGKYLHGCCWSS